MKLWISILGIACVALLVVTWIVLFPSKVPKIEKVEEWPMFRHDLANTGYTSAKGPEDNNVLWTFEVEFSVIAAPPVVANGKVFVPEMGVIDDEGHRYNYLYCIDAENGELIWKSEIGTTPSPPAVAGGKVYIGGGFDNTLWAFNVENGELIWNRVLPDTAYAAPTVVKNRVLYPTYRKLYCFNADNGELVWESWAGSGGNSLAVGGDRIYGGDSFHSLSIENGDILWSKAFWGTTLYSVPVYARGVVYISTWKTPKWAESRLYALDADTGEEMWSYLPGFLAVAKDRIAISTAEGLHCLNANTGELLWKFEEEWLSSPIIAGSTVYVGSFNGLWALSLESGEVLWRYWGEKYRGTIIVTGLSATDGKLFVSTDSKRLVCFGS